MIIIKKMSVIGSCMRNEVLCFVQSDILQKLITDGGREVSCSVCEVIDSSWVRLFFDG